MTRRGAILRTEVHPMSCRNFTMRRHRSSISAPAIARKCPPRKKSAAHDHPAHPKFGGYRRVSIRRRRSARQGMPLMLHDQFPVAPSARISANQIRRRAERFRAAIEASTSIFDASVGRPPARRRSRCHRGLSRPSGVCGRPPRMIRIVIIILPRRIGERPHGGRLRASPHWLR